MKNLRDTLFCIVFGALVIVVIAQHCAIKAPSSPISGQTTIEIPSIRQIQQRLNATGKKRYDPGKVDGKFGSKTRQALENYKCDEFAINELE
jgi:peptidoglycan hydrolase-like protein with peptidoglycan-binding domain